MPVTIRTPLLVAAAVLLAACGRDAQTEGDVTTTTSDGALAMSMSGDSADQRGVALVRVVNTVPDASELTVRADEAHALPGVGYKEVSEYQSIDNNWVRFQVSGSPTDPYAPLETNREMLTDGYRYTMVVLRDENGTGYRTRVLRDEIPAPDATRAHVRVIHAASGVNELNVVAQGSETLFDGVNYSSEAGFKQVAPWSGTLEFRTQDGNRRLLTLPNVDLQAGSAYTIVVTNKAAGGDIEAFWFSDAQSPAPMR